MNRASPITTTAPLPKARHWRPIVTYQTCDDGTLAAPWLREGDQAIWFSRGAWALRAIVDAVAHKIEGSLCVWLPDFFCNQAIWPLRQANVELVFYPVDRNLHPAWDEFDRLDAYGSADIFVLVHFFGFASDATVAREFCDAGGAVLVEDAAHMLFPASDVGKAGDFILYCQHKNLPIPDGSLLVVRESAGEFINIINSSLTCAAPSSLPWVFKRLLQSMAPTFAAQIVRRNVKAFEDDPPAMPMASAPAMSSCARRMLSKLLEELTPIADRRKENESAMRAIALAVEGINPFFDKPAEGDIPYRAVLQARDLDTARAWHNRITAQGNVVETWPDLPPEVRARPEQHATAIHLRNTLLAIPVHADRTPANLIETYGAVLRVN